MLVEGLLDLVDLVGARLALDLSRVGIRCSERRPCEEMPRQLALKIGNL